MPVMRIQPRVVVYRSMITDWFAHSVEFDLSESGIDPVDALKNLSAAIKDRLVKFAHAERYRRQFQLFRPVEPYIMYLFAAGEDQETNWQPESSDQI